MAGDFRQSSGVWNLRNWIFLLWEGNQLLNSVNNNQYKMESRMLWGEPNACKAQAAPEVWLSTSGRDQGLSQAPKCCCMITKGEKSKMKPNNRCRSEHNSRRSPFKKRKLTWEGVSTPWNLLLVVLSVRRSPKNWRLSYRNGDNPIMVHLHFPLLYKAFLKFLRAHSLKSVVFGQT